MKRELCFIDRKWNRKKKTTKYSYRQWYWYVKLLADYKDVKTLHFLSTYLEVRVDNGQAGKKFNNQAYQYKKQLGEYKEMKQNSSSPSSSCVQHQIHTHLTQPQGSLCLQPNRQTHKNPSHADKLVKFSSCRLVGCSFHDNSR